MRLLDEDCIRYDCGHKCNKKNKERDECERREGLVYEEMFLKGKSISPRSCAGDCASPVPTFLTQFLKFNFLLTILLIMLSHTTSYN